MNDRKRDAMPAAKTNSRRRHLRYLLIGLVAEKVVQHTIVTLSFFWNAADIRSTVAVDYRFLMVSGAIVALLFAVALRGVHRQTAWGLNLVFALALFDVAGEFVAQGTIFITITVSFLVAIALLALTWRWKSALRSQRSA